MKLGGIKKAVVLMDAIVIALIAFVILNSTVVSSIFGLIGKNAKASNSDLSFDLIASPEETKVKAGDTVIINLSAENIKVGENGLNSIVGYLGYDESLFESMEMYGGSYRDHVEKKDSSWNVELNQKKDHSMYGKFCIYSMQEGITKNEDVATIVLKLKDDLKPQTTKVTFTELASSDGNVEVPEEDRAVTIIIYEDEIPVEPVKPVEPKTGDNIWLMFAVVLVATLTIMLNIFVFGKNKKSKIFSVVALMVVSLACIGMEAYAISHTMKVDEEWEKLDYAQSWLDSEDYLVTAENISRISPETLVGNIKSKFNKEVVVYKQAAEGAEQEEVENEIANNDERAATGMKVAVKDATKVDAEGDYAYEVSVWGDTNGDGKSNQVDLTTIIRNVVDNEKWELTGVKYISADMAVDNEINEEDVKTSVKYIVYGEKDIPEFDEVEAPTVEIVEGEYDEDLKCYVSNVKVKVTEKQANAINTKIKIENTEGIVVDFEDIYAEENANAQDNNEAEGNEKQNNEQQNNQGNQAQYEVHEDEEGNKYIIVEFSEDDLYKISAYTTGKDGNRSEIPYVLFNLGNTETEYGYSIEYYYDDVKDETKTETGSAIYSVQFNNLTDIPEYSDKVIRGYEIDTAKGNSGVEGLPLTIGKDVSSNVVKIYYKATTYNLTYVMNDEDEIGGEVSRATCDENPSTYKVTTPDFTLNNPSRVGFTFTGWALTKLDGVDQENPSKNVQTIIEQGSIGDREYTANWIENTDTMYRFEYYKENLNGEYVLSEDSETFNNGTTGATVTIPEKTYAGFTEDTVNENRKISGVITPAGTLVLRRYYSRNSYKLTVVADSLVVEGNQIIHVSAVGNGHAGDGVEAVQATDGTGTPIPNTYVAEYKHGQPVDISAVVDAVTGYTTAFTKWESSDSSKVADQTTANAQITMPIGDITLTAKGTSTINSYGYTVEYFYNGTKDASKTVTGTAEYKSTIAYPSEKAPEKLINNYRFDKYIANGVENTALTISTNADNNKIQVYYVPTIAQLTIHHYKVGTTTKLADDETLQITIGQSYEITNLTNTANKIKVNGEVQDLTRNYLDSNKYTYQSVTADSANNQVGANGVVTGTSVDGMADISYYYSSETFTIDGGVIGGHGTIEGVPEEVEYGEDSEEEIVITPDDGYKVKSIRLYTGSEVDGDYDETDGEDVTRTMFTRVKTVFYLNEQIENVTENMYIAVWMEEAVPVAQVVAVPGNDTTLANLPSAIDGQRILLHTYVYLKDAIDDARKVNENNESHIPGNVEIKILKDIQSEADVIESGNYVTIDLNGHTISLEDENNNVLYVKEGAKLQIINKGNEINPATGKEAEIVNLEGISIYVHNGGELTLGENDGVVSISNPTIEGATYGIYREEESILNFYDGKVIGNTDSALAGYTQGINTPQLYEVSVQSEGTKETAIVMIPSGYEAMIGRTKYETLELAYEAVENNSSNTRNTPVEIDVIAEVTLEDPITLSENKNVVLDLNGHNINVTQANNMFINEGKMEIKDSTGDVLDGYQYAELVANGDYYFEKVGDHLESNNKGVSNSTANSYIKIDLSQKPEQYTYNLAVNANISSRGGYGYITVNESAEAPLPSDTNGRIAYVYGLDTYPQTYTKELTGGKTYYLHLGRSKDTNHGYLDTFQINNITLDGEPVIAELVKSRGKISSSTYDAVKNTSTGELKLSSGTVTSNNYGVDNYGKFTMTGGTLKSVNNNATEEGKTVELKGGMVYSTVNNVSNATLTFDDSVRYFNNGSTIENSGKLYIDGGTITGSRSNYYRISEIIMSYRNAELTINDGEILSGNNAVLSYGTATINGGEIKSGLGSVNINSGNCTFNDGNITRYAWGYYNYDDEFTVATSNDATFEMNGGTINSGRYAVTGSNITINDGDIISSGTALSVGTNVKVNGGSIYSAGGSGISINGTLDIGNQDNNVSTESPTIKSNSVGIEAGSNATVKMYDGQIIAPVGKTIRTPFNEIEEEDAQGNELTINISEIVEDETTYDRLIIAPAEKNIARILKTASGLNMSAIPSSSYTSDNTYYYFNNIQDAVDVCSSTAGSTVTTIEMLKDITIMYQVSVSEGKNIKLDLNGHKITSYYNGTVITNAGTFDIEDSADSENKGNVYSLREIFNNSGTAIINANLTSINRYTGDRPYGSNEPTNVIVTNSGKLTQNGGEITGYYARIINNTGEFILNDGTINALRQGDGQASTAIVTTGTSKVTVNGGTIYADNTSYRMGIRSYNTATIRINGGNIRGPISVNSTSSYVEGESEPALYVTGGIITDSISAPSTGAQRDIWIIKDTNSDLGISAGIDVSANLRIENSTVNSSVKNDEGLSTTIKNSTITGEIYLGQYGSVDSVEEITNSTVSNLTKRTIGTLTITNSTVNGVVSYSGYGATIHNYNTGTIVIPSVGNTTITSPQRAIYNVGAGTITLGTKGGGVSTEYPLIDAANIGVSNESGTFNFYDGKIISGNENSINGNVTDVEPGYDVVKTKAGGKETAILMKLAVAKILKTDVNVASLSGMEYVDLDEDYYGFYALEDAFSACKNNIETNVIQLRDITYTAAATSQTVPSNKKVVFDMAGYKIITGCDETIVNHGSLRIINSDTSKTSSIESKKNKLVTNDGSLTIEGITITTTYSGTTNSPATLIDNSGTTELNNTTVNADVSNGRLILNSGTLTVNGGKYYGHATREDYAIVENTGDVVFKESEMYDLPVVNNEHGTIEMIDMIIFRSKITNNSDKEYVSGSSKPAIRLKGGTYQFYVSTFTYARYGYNVTNNAGEIIIENNTDTNTELSTISMYDSGTIVNNSGKVTINSGKITSNITNKDTVNINGGTYTYSVGYGGITNETGATMNINSSSFTNASVVNRGTLNVGNNSDAITNDTPTFTSSTITNNATFNYYDGTISYAGIPVVNSITNIPTGSNVIVTKDGSTLTYSLSKTEIVAKIGNDEYKSLKEAFAHCTSNSNTTIDLVASAVVLGPEGITIDSNKDVTLNLNGNGVISYAEGALFTNNGTFEIIDSSVDGNGYVTGYSNNIVKNTGALTIANGSFETLGNGDRIIIKNENAGTVDVTGGTYNVSPYSTDYDTAVILSTSSGDVTVSGGTLNCKGSYHKYESTIRIVNTDTNVTPTLTIGGSTNITSQDYNRGFHIENAELVMSDGTVNGQYLNELVNSTATITGGRIPNGADIDSTSSLSVSGNPTVGAMDNEGTVTITGGTFTGQLTNKTNMTISNATFTGSGRVFNDRYYGHFSPVTTIEDSNFNNVTGPAIQIEGGTMTLRNDNISNNANETIRAYGGTLELAENVNVTHNGTQPGITVSGATVKIPYLTNDGNVNETTITATNGAGIEVNSGTLELGDKDYPVYRDYPEISGGTYGLKVTGGTVNIYDGIFHGSTKAFDGTITDTPELYSLLFTDSTEQTAYLQIEATVENVAQIGDMKYSTVQNAINVINNSGKTGTITLLKDVIITEPLTIPTGNNITLNLDGHSIRYSGDSVAIVNNGTLTIIDPDTAETDHNYGYIESVTGVAINNAGTLTLGEASETIKVNAPRIIGKTYAVTNTGTFNIDGGMAEGITDAVDGSVTTTSTHTLTDGTESRRVDGEEVIYKTKYLN